MKFSDNITNSINGDLSIKFIDRSSQKIIDQVDGSNIVVKNAYIQSLQFFDTGVGNFINHIKFGDDVGTGNISGPEQPTLDTTKDEQNVVLPTPQTDQIVVNRSVSTTDVSITSFVIINGSDILDLTGQDSIEFTSIGLYLDNDELFAYRRFPIRSISRVVDVSINWTIYYNTPSL